MGVGGSFNPRHSFKTKGKYTELNSIMQEIHSFFDKKFAFSFLRLPESLRKHRDYASKGIGSEETAEGIYGAERLERQSFLPTRWH